VVANSKGVAGAELSEGKDCRQRLWTPKGGLRQRVGEEENSNSVLVILAVLYPKKGVCADPVDKGAILEGGGGGTP
jgi:hypothetical protein